MALTIRARMKREIFAKPGWRVAVFERIDGTDGPEGTPEIRCVGALDHVAEGEDCNLRGEWQRHPRFGDQFKVYEAESVLPRDSKGVAGFLRRLSNIGPKRAEAIVERFGADQVFGVIEREPERLTEIPGLTERMIADITDTYAGLQHKRNAIVTMKRVGMTDWQIAKVFEFTAKKLRREQRNESDPDKRIAEIDDAALYRDIQATLQFDPYQYTHIKGFGFVTVDQIALASGVERQGIPRSRAGILYALEEAAKEGHCYLPGTEAAKLLRHLVGLKGPNVKAAADSLKEEGLIVTLPLADGGPDVAVYDRQLEACERRVGEFFADRTVGVELVEELRGAINDRLGAGDPPAGALNHEQQLAVDLGVHPDVRALVITGGPGVGKTHLVRELVRECEARGQHVGLCSPTGKAAKRLSEQTDREAMTVHRLLSYHPSEGWRHHAENPLPYSVVVLDEASMIDVELCHALVDAVAQGTKVILVGDVDQLPSIGPGNVLRDCIDSRRIATVRLTRIYRQSERSYIAENAKRMNKGQEPIIDPNAEDFFWSPTQSAEHCFQEAVRLVTELIPERHDVDPIADVQVLCPQRKGDIGIYRFNDELQARLNPGKGVRPQTAHARGTAFRVGDKVRHTKNNYELNVMNGEAGIISSIEDALDDRGKPCKRTHVDYGDRVVIYPREGALGEVVLNYGSTIHASQGSEYPIVVLLCHSYNYHMLSRNLIYTGLTRAKDAVYIIGDEKGLRRATKNTNVAKRYTLLAERIRSTA